MSPDDAAFVVVWLLVLAGSISVKEGSVTDWLHCMTIGMALISALDQV